MNLYKDKFDTVRRNPYSIPSLLEPTGIARSDGRRPDGISVMPWRNGRTLVWDATCPDTFAPSNVALTAREAGLVASQAEKAKTQKYALLGSSHHFVPFAIETSGVFGPEAITFIRELGHRIRAETGEPCSLQFLMQRIAVAVQRGNAAAVRGTSPPTDNVFLTICLFRMIMHIIYIKLHYLYMY